MLYAASVCKVFPGQVRAVVKSWSGFYGWGVGWVPQGAGGQEQEASVHANQESEFKDQLMLEESS